MSEAETVMLAVPVNEHDPHGGANERTDYSGQLWRLPVLAGR